MDEYFKDMVDLKLAGHESLIQGINRLYLQYLEETWIPLSIELIHEALFIDKIKWHTLGLPACHEDISFTSSKSSSASFKKTKKKCFLKISYIYGIIDKT